MKLPKNANKLDFWGNKLFVGVFYDFFKNGMLKRAVVSCVAISVSRRFFWAIKFNKHTFFSDF